MPITSYMRRTITLASEGLKDGGSPFAALVVNRNVVLGSGRNETTSGSDPLAHAEIVAIRNASMRYGASALVGATLYTSCEPCLMCTAACFYAAIHSVVYAASLEDVIRLSSGDLPLGAADFASYCGMKIAFSQQERESAVAVVREFHKHYGHL